MLRSIGANGPMIEVGCGKGLVVLDLRARGHDVVGVDIAKIEVAAGASAWVRTGTEALALPEAEAKLYRTLLLLDVIEHIENPTGFIAQLRNAFPKAEWIVATVPARQELFSEHDTFNRHFRRYDPRTLRMHMDPSAHPGWKACYFFHTLYPFAWLQARWSKGRRTFSGPKGLANAIHAALGCAFFLDHLALPGRLWGTSIICAARIR
ncbi:MAG: methyltransferase domain-containing protein [Flavobacteriales bacterium]|nr:methyltransferase domain-containing protein [Flavobacteriales bacterium]